MLVKEDEDSSFGAFEEQPDLDAISRKELSERIRLMKDQIRRVQQE